MTNWSELNQDLVVEIAKRIKLYQDFVAFRWVCTSWRSEANIKNFSYKCDQMPLLLLPPDDDDDDGSGNRRRFFNPSNAMTRQVCLPEAAAADANKRCLSSKGWLLSIARDLSLTLVHPFSRAEIELPNVKAFQDWYDNLSNIAGYGNYIEKFVLTTSNLLESDFAIMVIYGSPRKLAFFKSGQKNWITADNRSCYFDVVYYKDKIHALDARGKIMAWDLSGDDPSVAELVAEMPSEIVESRALEKLYLVESDGELLVVRRQGAYARDYYNSCYGAYAFQVFKVDLLTNTWMEIKDIGNRALFLGHNSSLSVQALDSSICVPNSIYFTDDCWVSYMSRRRRGGGKDMGIYNIQDGSIVPHFKGKFCPRSRFAPPMWVEQSFS